MNKKKFTKLLALYLPYLVIGLAATNLGEAWRLAEGKELGDKIVSLMGTLPAAFANPLPSLHPLDILVGICCGAGLRLAVYLKSKNAKKYRHGMEYGSARWGTPADIAPFIAPKFEDNIILTKTERLMMSNRPPDPKNARNKNVLVVGGSGSGKTRYFIKPNLLQCTSKSHPVSFVVTDPKGGLIQECGLALLKNGYKIRTMNTINFHKSMRYNPFAYIHEEKDILKLVTTLMTNTKGDGSGGDPFWEKSERLLLTALIAYLHYEAPPEEQNFAMVMEMLRAGAIEDEDAPSPSPLDNLFSDLMIDNPDHIALKYYHSYHSGSSKTLKSIQITLAARLEKFNLESLAALTSADELDLQSLGEKKVALFALIPDNDSSFNFLVSILYTQLFQQLFYAADHIHGGCLPMPVHFMMDEFANVSLPDDFDKILSVMRSRGVSVSIILQNLAQLKALFEKQWESIVGNCDEFLYLGGNEQSTHKYVSELLGKETIDTNTFGKSTGRSGNYSTNYQISGRELLTPDEVRMLDNQYAILFIRGERPIMDFKYDIMKHPNVALTTDGKASPYKHGEVTKDIASIAIWDIDPATLPEKEMEETNWELLSDEEMEALFINNQTN